MSKLPQMMAQEMNQKLRDWLDVTEADIDLNKRGKLSPKQRRSWWINLGIFVGGLLALAVVLYLAGGQLWDQEQRLGGALILVGFAFIGFVWQVLLRLFRKPDVVSGMVELRTVQKGASMPTHHLVIGGKELDIDFMPPSGLLLKNMSYIAYHHAGKLLAIEIDPRAIASS